MKNNQKQNSDTKPATTGGSKKPAVARTVKRGDAKKPAAAAAKRGGSTKAGTKVQAAFFEDVGGARPVREVFVTGAQFAEIFPGFDDARLRNLAPVWFPKPKDGNYDLVLTASGIVRWLERRLEDRSGLPGEFANMGDFCAGTGFPRDMLEYALKNGSGARVSSNRIKLAPVLAFFKNLFERIPWTDTFFKGVNKSIAGLEAFKQLDLDEEKAALTEQQKIAAERENRLANESIFSREEIEQRVREEVLAPLKNGLAALLKKFTRFQASQPLIGNEILAQDLPLMMAALAAALPATAALVAERPPMETVNDYSI